jgi:hypothetical protein
MAVKKTLAMATGTKMIAHQRAALMQARLRQSSLPRKMPA